MKWTCLAVNFKTIKIMGPPDVLHPIEFYITLKDWFNLALTEIRTVSGNQQTLAGTVEFFQGNNKETVASPVKTRYCRQKQDKRG